MAVRSMSEWCQPQSRVKTRVSPWSPHASSVIFRNKPVSPITRHLLSLLACVDQAISKPSDIRADRKTCLNFFTVTAGFVVFHRAPHCDSTISILTLSVLYGFCVSDIACTLIIGKIYLTIIKKVK